MGMNLYIMIEDNSKVLYSTVGQCSVCVCVCNQKNIFSFQLKT